MQAIKHSFQTSALPSAVYSALSTEQGYRNWWCTNCDVGSKAGDAVELRFDKDGTPVTMNFNIETLEDGKRVVWRCTENSNPVWKGSTLEWNISPGATGSQVEFSHDHFAGGGPPYEMTAEGWKRFWTSLEDYLQGKTANPL